MSLLLNCDYKTATKGYRGKNEKDTTRHIINNNSQNRFSLIIRQVNW